MTEETFKREIERLQRTYLAKHYPPERVKLFWRTYQHEKDEVFIAAIDLAIASSRNAPLFKELDGYLTEARKMDTYRRYAPMGTGGFGSILQEAERENKTADKEYVKMVIEHFRKVSDKKITLDEFLKAYPEIEKLGEQLNPKVRKQVGGPNDKIR